MVLSRNPTPYGVKDPLLGVTWPDSGMSGQHLEINRNLAVGLRPINSQVERNEAAGLGNSRVLNQCFRNGFKSTPKKLKGRY